MPSTFRRRLEQRTMRRTSRRRFRLLRPWNLAPVQTSRGRFALHNPPPRTGWVMSSGPKLPTAIALSRWNSWARPRLAPSNDRPFRHLRQPLSRSVRKETSTGYFANCRLHIQPAAPVLVWLPKQEAVASHAQTHSTFFARDRIGQTTLATHKTYCSPFYILEEPGFADLDCDFLFLEIALSSLSRNSWLRPPLL